MAFLLNSQAQGKVYLPKMNNLPKHHGAGPQRRGASEARGPMQLHRLHWLKAGPASQMKWLGGLDLACGTYSSLPTAGIGYLSLLCMLSLGAQAVATSNPDMIKKQRNKRYCACDISVHFWCVIISDICLRLASKHNGLHDHLNESRAHNV